MLYDSGPAALGGAGSGPGGSAGEHQWYYLDKSKTQKGPVRCVTVVSAFRVPLHMQMFAHGKRTAQPRRSHQIIQGISN